MTKWIQHVDVTRLIVSVLAVTLLPWAIWTTTAILRLELDLAVFRQEFHDSMRAAQTRPDQPQTLAQD